MLLGLYDIFKKASVRENAVPPVLLASVVTGALFWLPSAAASVLGWDMAGWGVLQVERIGVYGHLLLFLKSVLVRGSWTCAFCALKHLPVSIAAPLRATSPV